MHKGTYTYKAFFSNKNLSMLANVLKLTRKLGFHSHAGTNQVQISRKAEVYAFLDLIKFRKY